MQPMTQSSEYEFNNVQNALIGELAAKMKFVGTMGMILGVVFPLFGVYAIVMGKGLGQGPAITNIILGIAGFVVGSWTRGAAERFQNIVDTEGSDIANLMVALEELRRVYALQRVVIIITAVTMLVAVQVYLTFMASH